MGSLRTTNKCRWSQNTHKYNFAMDPITNRSDCRRRRRSGRCLGRNKRNGISSNSSNSNNNDHDRDCDTAISLIDSAVALLSDGVDDIDNNNDWWNSSQTNLSDNINKNNKYDYHFEQDDKDDVESQIEEVCEDDDDADSISLSLASSSSSSSVHSLATFDDEDDIDSLPFETKPTGSGAGAAGQQDKAITVP